MGMRDGKPEGDLGRRRGGGSTGGIVLSLRAEKRSCVCGGEEERRRNRTPRRENLRRWGKRIIWKKKRERKGFCRNGGGRARIKKVGESVLRSQEKVRFFQPEFLGALQRHSLGERDDAEAMTIRKKGRRQREKKKTKP